DVASWMRPPRRLVAGGEDTQVGTIRVRQRDGVVRVAAVGSAGCVQAASKSRLPLTSHHLLVCNIVRNLHPRAGGSPLVVMEPAKCPDICTSAKSTQKTSLSQRLPGRYPARWKGLRKRGRLAAIGPSR